MSKKKKVKKALVPYGENRAQKALEEALRRTKKGGELFLLHITDEGRTRNVRYTTGQLGTENETIKSVRKGIKKTQKKATKEYTETAKEKADERDISVKLISVIGDPAKEILKVIEKYAIQLVVVQNLRDRMSEILLGDEIGYLKEKAPCEIITVS